MARICRRATGGLRQRPEDKLRWTVSDAREALDAWREHGGSLVGFCRPRGIHPERLRRWRRHLGVPSAGLKASGKTTPAPAEGWVEAVITGTTGGSSVVVVQLRGGDRIEVADPARVDAGWLSRLVAGLAEQR